MAKKWSKKEIEEYIGTKQISQENYVAPVVETNYVPREQRTIQSVANTVDTFNNVNNNLKQVQTTVEPVTTEKKKQENNSFSFSIDDAKKKNTVADDILNQEKVKKRETEGKAREQQLYDSIITGTTGEKRQEAIKEFNKKVEELDREYGITPEERKQINNKKYNKEKTADELFDEYTTAKNELEVYENKKGINLFNRYKDNNVNNEEYQNLIQNAKDKYSQYYNAKEKEKDKATGGILGAWKDGYNFGDVTKTIGNIVDRNIIDKAYSLGESISIDPKNALKGYGTGILSGIENTNKTIDRALQDAGNFITGRNKDDKPLSSMNVNDYNRLVQYGTDEEKRNYLELVEQDYKNNKISKKMYDTYKSALTSKDTRSNTIKNISNFLDPDYQQSEVYKKWQNGELTPGEELIINQGSQLGSQIPAMVTTYMFGPKAGKTLFWTQAQQNYTEEAKQRGYSDSNARKFGLIMGSVDTVIEELGFDEFGGLKNMAKDSLAKAAIGEAMEEAVTPWIDYGVRTLFGEKYDVDAAAKEAIEGAISAAFTAVVMSAGSKGFVKADSVINKVNRGEQVSSQELSDAVKEIEQKNPEAVSSKVNQYLKTIFGNNQQTDQLNQQNKPLEQVIREDLAQEEQQTQEQPIQTPLNTLNRGVLQENSQTPIQEQTPQITPLNQVNQELQETRQNDIANTVQAMNLEQEPQFTQKQGNYVYEKSDNSKIDTFRKDAATYLKAGEQTDNFVKTLEKIIEDKDIEIRFDPNLRDNQGRMANGSYSNNVITLNPNSNRAGEFLAIHELTHAIGTKSMIDMIQKYRKSNAEFDSAVKRLLTTYKATEINEEALGDIAGQLFGNQEYINNLSMENPSLFKKIYNEIKYLWHQFTGYKNQNQFIEDLRNKWESAYRNSKAKQTSKTGYSLEERVSGDKLLDTQDLINEIKDVGAEVDDNGYVTVYHQTTDENAQKIRETGQMISKEPSVFFSTSKNASQSDGRGTTKLEFKIPAEELELDDLFSDNADVKIRLNGKNSLDVSNYLVDNNQNNKELDNSSFSIDKNDTKYSKQEGYTQEENNNLRDKAKEELGTTTNLNEAGYLTNDGNYLDFSGKKQGARGGSRQMDHREVSDIYSDEEYDNAESKYPNMGSATAILQDFMDRGNIRLNNTGVEISVPPTAEQYDKLYDYLEHVKEINGDVFIDLDTETNNRENLEYNSNISVSKMIKDIKNHYESKYSKDNATWREYLEKEFPSQGTRTNLQDINERNKPKQENKTTQEEKPQEMPKKEVKKSFLNSKEQEELNNLKDLYDTGLLEETDADYKRMQELEKKSQGITKKFPELNKTVTQDDTKSLYFKYKNNEISKENRKILNEAKKIVESNKQNRRTKEQWLQVAEYIGANANVKSSQDLQRLAMETWLESKPNNRENLNRQGKKYIEFKTNEWFNAMYKGAGVGTDVKMSLEEATDNKGKKVDLKPIQNNTYEKVNTKPKKNEIISKDDIVNEVLNIGDKKVSNFYSNATEKSKFITEENRVKLMDNDTLKYYDAINNKETLQDALNKLDSNTEKQIGDFFTKKEFTAEDVATGWILVKRYQDAGNFEAMSNVIERMRQQGTKAGQTIQMYGMLERLTPEGMEYYSQKQLDNAFNEFSKNKSKKQIEKYANDFTLTAEEHQFIKDTMEKVQKMTDDNAKKVEIAKIVSMLSDKLPPEKGSRLKSWMRISMLGNPKTQVRNIVGNAIIQPVNWVGDVFSSVADKLVSKKTGVRTKGATDFGALARGTKQGFKESIRDAKLGIDTRDINLNRFEENIGAKPFYEKHTGAAKVLNPVAKGLNKVNKILSNVMSGGDRVFYQGIYENSLQNQMKLNKVEVPTQEMIDIAEQEALQRTWNDSNEYTKAVLQIRNAMNKINVKGYGLGDVLVPFAKTPANLTKAIVDYSPLGLTRTILSDGRKLKNSLQNGQYNAQLQHKFADSLGKGFAGSLLWVAAYGLAKAGITSGASDDDKDVANFMRNTLGIQPYSVKVGDKSFTYDWAQPIAAPFAMMADIESKKNNTKDEQDLLSYIKTAGNTGLNILLDQSFLSSIQDVFNSYEGPGAAIQQQIEDLPARATPTFFKQIADLIDPKSRQTYVKGDASQTLKNKVQVKIPGASKELTAQRDTLGREIEKYGGNDNTLKYAFNVFLNPANTNKGKPSEAAEEIYAVYKATGDKTIMPRQVGYSENIGGTTRNLTAKERNEWQRLSGEKIEENVKALIQNNKYNEMSNEDKAAVINGIVNYSFAKAKSDLFNTNISTMYKTAAKKEEQGIPLYDYYIDRISKRK